MIITNRKYRIKTEKTKRVIGSLRTQIFEHFAAPDFGGDRYKIKFALLDEDEYFQVYIVMIHIITSQAIIISEGLFGQLR